MWATDVRRTDAPVVSEIDADHNVRTRREESLRPFSGSARAWPVRSWRGARADVGPASTLLFGTRWRL